MKDYYEILGVQKNASAAELKDAYRRLAMKYHPDRNSGDKSAETKFKDAKEAYETLADSQKRAIYDQYGHEGIAGMRGAGGSAGAQGFGGGFEGFADIFGDFFGDAFGGQGGRGRGGPQRGSDLGYNQALDLEQAVFGADITIRIPTLVNCGECGGSGARKGTKATSCKTCGGSGMVQLRQGPFVLQQPCPKCHGQGTVIADPCPKCRGQGRLRTEKTLSVHIPAGVDNGDRIRLSGEGEAGPHGGPAGDLYVQVSLRPHPIFKRQGSDLYCDVPITFAQAALGGEVEVPTLEGRVKLKIPPETQSGKSFRLRGRGVRGSHGHFAGDLYCNVVVETPVNLSNEQRDLLQKFATSLEHDTKNHTPRARTWFESLKKFFER